MSTFATRDDGPATERSVANDIVKRALIITPLALAIGGAFGGFDGAASVAYGLGLVVVNFVLSALLITKTAKISLGLMGAAVLFGYLMRLALIFLAVWLVHDAGWISLPWLGATIIVTHLGLLVWELKYVAMSLAFPGLKPTARTTVPPKPIASKTIPAADQPKPIN
jgi:hypothetical protein